MRNKIATSAILVLISGFLVGCATPARVGSMVDPTEIRSTATPEHLRKNIVVTSVTGGQDTNPLWTSEIGSQEFQTALELSLNRAGLLGMVGDTSAYLLRVTMLEVSQPFVGIDLTVTAKVLYTISEKATGRVIYEKNISTPYTAAFSESFLAVERLRKANEGAARENIKAFVDDLYQFQPR